MTYSLFWYTRQGLFGSATCLLAVLMNDELRVANLGDCAIVVIRDGEIVFRTEEMQHSVSVSSGDHLTPGGSSAFLRSP